MDQTKRNDSQAELKAGYQRESKSQSTEDKRALARETYERLSEKERRRLAYIIAQTRAGNKHLLNDLRSEVYAEPPLDIKTLLDSKYYFGAFAEFLYPRLKEDIVEIFSHDYSNIIYTGGIGTGKSTAASMIGAVMIMQLMQMRNPQQTFGMMPNQPISLILIAPQKGTASMVLFESMCNIFGDSPYFREHHPATIRKTDGYIEFPDKKVQVIVKAGNETTILGLSSIGAIMDEGNFYSRGGGSAEEDKAEQLYRALLERLKSRFMGYGTNPAKLILLSSKTHYDSFVDRIIKEVRDDPSSFVREYSVWDVKPDQFSKEKIKVYIGSAVDPPRIVQPEEYATMKPYENYIIDVPKDFEMDFERDIFRSLRNYAGVATAAVHPFFRDPRAIDGCVRYDFIDGAVKRPWKHPIATYEVQYSSEPPQIDWRLLTRVDDAKVEKPILNPSAKRFVHLDIGLKHDATGITIAHVGDTITTDGGLRKPVIYIDFMLRLLPPVAGEIRISDIKELILKFREHGYDIFQVTADQFQSADLLQSFESMGIRSSRLSVDTSTKGYTLLKDLIYDGRVQYYFYPPVIEELKKLEFDVQKQKVDHRAKEHKDVSDSLAAACLSIMNTIENDSGILYPTLDVFVASGSVMREESLKKSMKEFGIPVYQTADKAMNDWFDQATQTDADKFHEFVMDSLEVYNRGGYGKV